MGSKRCGARFAVTLALTLSLLGLYCKRQSELVRVRRANHYGRRDRGAGLAP